MSGLKNRLYGILALAAAVVLLAGCLFTVAVWILELCGVKLW